MFIILWLGLDTAKNITLISSSESSALFEYIAPNGFYDVLVLECFNLENNFTTINYCTSASNQCTCNHLLAGSFFKYQMKTIKNGFKNVTTDFYYFQTSKLDKNIRNYF